MKPTKTASKPTKTVAAPTKPAKGAPIKPGGLQQALTKKGC